MRAVIREVLPDGVSAPVGGTPVSLSSDAELDAFVRRVAELCDDPGRRAAFREGRHGFVLAEGLDTPLVPRGYSTSERLGGRAGAPGEAYRDQVVRIERGAVTERAVLKADKTGSRLVLGPRAVMTPLARDRARVLGVEIERER